FANPACCTSIVYVPTGKTGNAKRPSGSLVVSNPILVVVLVAVSFAPWIAPPDGSTTLPSKDAWLPWPQTLVGSKTTLTMASNTPRHNPNLLLMKKPPILDSCSWQQAT